jgi:putative acetyltransferase
MNIIELNIRQDKLIQQLVEIWQQSVRQTHLFLSDSEIDDIKNTFH